MKKLLLVFLVIVLCVGFCSCGNTTSPTAQNQNDAQSCEHKFVEKNGEIICKLCKEPCVHDYSIVNGKYVCDFCEIECKHEYKINNNKNICAHCGKEKVVLTAENIGDYLQFTLAYDYYPKEESYGYQFCEVDVTLTIKPKVDVEFSNLVLTYQFIPLTENWSKGSPAQLEIPFNGEYTGVFNINSLYKEYVYDQPRFEFNVSAVSGELVD